MYILLKLIYRFQATPIKILAGFYVDIDKLLLKFTWNYVGLRMGKTTLKNKVGELIVQDLKWLSSSSSSNDIGSAYNPGDLGSIPGLGRSPGEGNGKPLQYPYLENPMDREAW